MVQKLICETMLKAYKSLETNCKMIDYFVSKQASVSASKDVFYTFNSIVNLINEKIAYCNLKVIIDEAIDGLKDIEELKSHYILGLSQQEIGDKLGVTQQVIYSRLKTQIKTLCKRILKKHSSLELFEIISDSKWLMNRYKELKRAKQKEKK